jgi:ribosomal protein S11
MGFRGSKEHPYAAQMAAEVAIEAGLKKSEGVC